MSKYLSKNRLNVKQPAIMEEFYFGRSSGHFTGNFYPHKMLLPLRETRAKAGVHSFPPNLVLAILGNDYKNILHP